MSGRGGGEVWRRLRPWVRVGGSLALLAWVASGLEWEAFGEAWRRVDAVTWGVAVVLYVVAQVVSGVRWWWVARGLGVAASARACVRWTFEGMLFNAVLPTGIGGDVIRGANLARASGRAGAAVWSVLLERAWGVAAILVTGAAAVVAAGPAETLPGLWGAGLAGAAVVVTAGVVAVPRLGAGLRRRLPERVAAVVPTVEAGVAGAGVWEGASFVASVLVQVLNIGIYAWLGGALGVMEGPAYWAAVFAPVTLLTLLPVSVGGLGLREAALAAFLAERGAAPEAAVLLGLLFFSVQLAASVPGAVSLAIGRRGGA